ncbi:MAG TPA: hypothetical protein P5080_00330 [Candidatus Paceibacterota bacterium]|nr:hypothetical protein [Candidatus Pacearchaeota archaeon]HRZ50421.1 hypothetical protein [Candidatus Paceibacterota bacterium]HSA36142.1 hypothetical protein [Candidatus Paceibacterota bacterium]
MTKKNISAAFLAFVAIFWVAPDLSFAAVTNVMSCGNWGSTIVPTSPVSGSYTDGQTVTFSGTVKSNVAASGYTAGWSGGIMEFYMMEDAKVPLIDACNDEYYDQESCLMYSCSTAGSCPTLSPSVPCPLKWPGCKWSPCSSCCGKIQDWCGSSKIPYCDEVDTVNTGGATKIIKLGSYSPSSVSKVNSFSYNKTFVLPTASFSGNARFVVYYRGIMQRWDPFGKLIIAGGPNSSTSAYTWQAAYSTVSYIPCTCGAWTNQACGGGSCQDTKRYQTRTCTPAGCKSEGQCVNDATCCSCGSWTNGACGGGTCSLRQRNQTRVCNPAGCQSASQCVADNSCINLSASLSVSPSSGNSPLSSMLTATASGNAQGTLNYYFWWNCNDTCSTLSACQAACQAPDHQSLNNASATYSILTTYTASATPKVLIEREGLTAEARSSVSACSCGSWSTAGTCGTGGCTLLQKLQTRTCNPAACLAETQCVADPTCCVCTAWADDDCGLGSCAADQMRQNRTCAPSGCLSESQCVASSSCPKTLNVAVAVSPDHGNAPLDTTITATVSGNIAGTVNYTVWYDCNSACSTVVGCVADCGVWNAKDDGSNDTVKSYVHTYAAAGTYLPKIIVERGSMVAFGSDTVTVSPASTLLVDIAAAPFSGNAPLATILAATVSGTAAGTINYTAWFDCNDSCSTVADCLIACGAWDDKEDGSSAAVKTLNHTYAAIGVYTPKIVVERASLTASDTDTVTVVSGGGPATLSVDVVAAPDSGSAPLNVVLTGTVSGTAAGTINYTVWFDCNDSCSTVAGCLIACGAWDDKEDGSSAAVKTLNHTYAAAGLYVPKMIVERESLAASESATVTVSVSNDPPAADTLVFQNDFCASGLATIFSWNYSDPENNPQAHCQVQVDDDPDFSSPADDSGKIISSSNSYATLASKLQYDTAYYWRLKVWDSQGQESGWITGTGFTTPLHGYPSVDFSLSPADPKVDDIVTYTDDTQVFGGATFASRSWVIQGAVPNTSVAETFTVVYPVKGNYTTKLTVTDSSGYTCSLEKNIMVKKSIPDWEEQ